MLPPERTRLQGYLAVSLSAVLFGMWASLGKLVEETVPPLTVALYAQVLPGLLFLPALLKYGFPRQRLRLLFFVSLAGSFVAPLFYFFGLEKTTAANAAFLSNTESLFTILFAFFFLGERLTRPGYAALGGIVAGAFIVTTEFRFGDLAYTPFLVGNLLLLVAACFWGMDNNGSTVLSQRTRILPLISLKLLVGSVFLFPVAIAAGSPLLVAPMDTVLLVFLAFAGVSGFTVLFYYAFRTIGAMRAGSVLSTSSLWGVLIALVVFPGQGLSFWQIVGGSLMLLSTIALYVVGERHDAAVSAAEGETLKEAASDGPKLP